MTWHRVAAIVLGVMANRLVMDWLQPKPAWLQYVGAGLAVGLAVWLADRLAIRRGWTRSG